MDLVARGGDSPVSDKSDLPRSLGTSADSPDSPVEGTITDVSCQRCRKRRVKCSRTFPRCSNCTNRREACTLKNWTPLPAGEERPRGRLAKKSKAHHRIKDGAVPPIIVPKESATRVPMRNAVRDEPSTSSADEDSVPFKTPKSTSNRALPVEPYGSPLDAPLSSAAASSLATRLTSISPSEIVLNRGAATPLLSLRTVLQRRQPRLALCKTLTQGEASLAGLVFPALDFPSLSGQLASNCPVSPDSSSFLANYSASSLVASASLPTSGAASQALTTYFAHIEPSLHLFQTNASRQFLYEGSKQLWDTEVVWGGLEWQALYLATMGASAAVSTDDEYVATARGWMRSAVQIVLEDLRFASNPTLVSLRTLLLVLHAHLLGCFTSLQLSETLALLPTLLSSAYKLELNFDLTDLNPAASTDATEERRGLWWHVSKLETIWSTLLHASNPTIDFSSVSTRPPFHLTSNAPPGTVAPNETLSQFSPDTVLHLLSRLGRLVNSNFLNASRDIDLLSVELLVCERDLYAREEATMYRSMVNYGLLRLHAFGEETTGAIVLSEVEWSRVVANLLELVSNVPECDMVDRLPTLLLILQGAVVAALRLVGLSSSSQEPLSLSLHTHLRDLANSLRTTPWPAYLHQFVKRGVIVVEHLLVRSASTAPLVPSLTQSLPDSVQRSRT